jgi:hypothetical protein
MIVAIADDISSAAEVAGAAVQLGFSAEVHTVFDPSAPVDVVALDTDSRALSVEEAGRRVAKFSRSVFEAEPDWIYKKIDSVLRGHVRVEVEATLASTRKTRAVLVPANPSRGRILRDGTYFVEGVPLSETAFANDPHFPSHSANVVTLVDGRARDGGLPVTSLGRREPLSRAAIYLPDVGEREDLVFRAKGVEETTLPAGGADFFEVLLQVRGGASTLSVTNQKPDEFSSGPALMVCGSGAAWAAGRAKECRQRQIPVLTLPADLFKEPSDDGALEDALLDSWAKRATRALDAAGNVMLAIGDSGGAPVSASPEVLAGRLVKAATRVCSERRIQRLYLEGGATASVLLKRMGWTRLAAAKLFAPGMPAFEISGSPGGPLLFLKPGSYPWPDLAWPRAP